MLCGDGVRVRDDEAASLREGVRTERAARIGFTHETSDRAATCAIRLACGLTAVRTAAAVDLESVCLVAFMVG